MQFHNQRSLALAAVTLMLTGLTTGCAAGKFLRYKINPDFPEFSDGEVIFMSGLSQPAQVWQRHDDGMYKIVAANEQDGARVVGYLQARDRFFQMDLLRHAARGEVAELLGDIRVGDKSVLDSDRFNRFVGHKQAAEQLLAAMTPADRALLDAYVAGVNHWIATGPTPLEHRLLGIAPQAWRAEDTWVVLRLVMFGLTHNYSREVRRLLIACDAGLDALERIWPNRMEAGPYFLPPETLPAKIFDLPPAVVPEMRANLDDLCPPAAATSAASLPESHDAPFAELATLLNGFATGMQASNNWAIAPARTASGGVIVENDPHLPHMNPPILWGMNLIVGDQRVAGFTVPGIFMAIFGTNTHVAWAETINNVDLQDVYLEYPGDHTDAPMQATSYLYDGIVHTFAVRRETFNVKGGEPQTYTARFTPHGPVLNDIDPFLAEHAPLLTLKSVAVDNSGDAQAARGVAAAKDTQSALAAIQPMDSACFSWVVGGKDGSIGWSSPCRVPVRKHWLGTFPAPGWLSKYEWSGTYAKNEIPRALNPARGWLATANNQPLPLNKFPTPYATDVAPANRYSLLAAALDKAAKVDATWVARLAMNTQQEYWPRVRAEIGDAFCADVANESRAMQDARRHLCAWNGDMAGDSTGGTLFVLTTYGLLDQGLADELGSGPDGTLWRYILDVPHIEANIDRFWQRPINDPVWDNVKTGAVETKIETLDAALAQAVVTGTKAYGPDIAQWQWGRVRPFVLKHPFGGASAAVAALFNSPPLPGLGGPETIFKNQFVRADRETMHPAIGPAIRIITDFGVTDGTWYALAGGQSGWPLSPYYANLLENWRYGKLRKLWVSEGDAAIKVEFRGD